MLEATRTIASMPLEEGVRWVFEHVAKPRMDADKQHYDEFYRGRCHEVPIESFRANFTAALESFVVGGMGLPLDGGLIARLEAHDTSRTASKHSSSASSETKQRIRGLIMSDQEMAAWVASVS